MLLAVALVLILQSSPVAKPQTGITSTSAASPTMSQTNSPPALPSSYTVNLGKLPPVTVTPSKRDSVDWPGTSIQSEPNRSRELRSWVDYLLIMKRGVSVFTYINNHYAGYGPATAEQFLKAWDK
jgi:hypothetical protein